MFFDIQSDLSDISETANSTLQFFVTIDSNHDNDTIIKNLSFMMTLITILEFLELALDKSQSVFMLDSQVM